MNDIVPPTPRNKRHLEVARPKPAEPVDPTVPATEVASPPPANPKRSRRRLRLVLMAASGLVVALVVACLTWYLLALQPVDSSDDEKRPIEIVAGSSPRQIADELHDEGVIRSTLAFEIYTRLSQTRNKLQAGTYGLSPSQSTPDIVSALTGGLVMNNEIEITFVPGAMLHDRSDKPAEKKQDIYQTLLRAGYSESEITAALQADYEGPLFAGRPQGEGIEGYVYGDTYRFARDASVEDILQRTFDELAAVIEQYDLVAAYKKQGLTLYEGITLASIIQREVDAGNADGGDVPSQDQRQVAQVFYTRMKIDMPLGADATFVYAANREGVAPAIDLDSPYNTRKHVGLPPGPISSPGVKALRAAADPATTDYLYFVSGDDGKTHFAHTLEQHEANTAKYCQQQCRMF